MSEDKPRLEVYLKRSVLVHEDGTAHQFDEGSPSAQAKQRLEKIRQELTAGFLTRIIAVCKEPGYAADPIDANHHSLLTILVDSVTSEIG